jgi:hypothetical protein
MFSVNWKHEVAVACADAKTAPAKTPAEIVAIATFFKFKFIKILIIL